MAASADSRIGKELAGYRVEALMGRGGMGVVYRAHDLALDRDVALKLLAPQLANDVSFRERFLTESRVAASLEHPNVVPIHDAGEIDGQLYIVMRLVEGDDLKAVLREGPLEPARAVRILEQIAGALDAAHARGLVHRDVKPSNVLLDEREHAYLADFGLSRYLGDAALPLGPAKSLGTADYVAPEQIRGEEVDGRADVYALGCMLYECLAGEPPFRRGTDAATLYAQLEEAPPGLPELEEVLPRALAKEPDGRYATCGELIDDTREALGIAEPKRSRWPLAVAVVGVALIGAALAGFFLTHGDGGVAAEPGADQLLRIDPAANRVTLSTAVGRQTSGIALGDGKVWVSSFADGNVRRFDPKTKKLLQLSTGGSPTSIARRPGLVVAANGPQHNLAFIDEASGQVTFVDSLPRAGNGVLDVAATRYAVWFADPGARVVGTDPSADQRRIGIPPGHPGLISSYKSFDGIAADGNSVWVAGEDGVLWRLDARAGQIVGKVALGFVPRSIASGEGAVWVTSLLGDTVTRIDPATNRVAATIRAGNGVAGIAAGGGAVWVANALDGTVTRIDPATNRVVARIPVEGVPGAVAADDNGVWVTARKRPAGPAPGQIGVGVLSDCRGPWAYAYQDTIAGAELALIEHGGRLAGRAVTSGVRDVTIHGHPVRLFLGCADGTNASTLTEARRLVDEVGVQVLIGPLSSNEGIALQDFARSRPQVAFVNGSAAAFLSHPAPNFFSFQSNGAQWMAGLGAYAYRNLGWRHAVTIAGEGTDDVFGWLQVAGFVSEFCSLGGKVTKRIWIPPGTQDFAATVAQIPPSGVDGVVMVAGSDATIGVAKGYRSFRKNLPKRMILSILAITGNQPLGQRAVGLVTGIGVPPGSYRWAARLHRAFPKLNGGLFGSPFDIYYHDATTATLRALDEVGGDLSDGGRRFQAALATVELDSSPQGHVRLDSTHQGITPNYVWQLGRRVPTLLRTIPGVERTFGGYLTSAVRPAKSTPACVKRTPPPWAR